MAFSLAERLVVVNPRFDTRGKIAGATRVAADAGLISTGVEWYCVWHEIAHALQSQSIGPGELKRLSKTKFDVGTARFLRSQVSHRAGDNAAEMVAEVYSGMRAGKIYSQRVMDLYRRNRGP
jgi:hypothetical protein